MWLYVTSDRPFKIITKQKNAKIPTVNFLNNLPWCHSWVVHVNRQHRQCDPPQFENRPPDMSHLYLRDAQLDDTWECCICSCPKKGDLNELFVNPLKESKMFKHFKMMRQSFSIYLNNKAFAGIVVCLAFLSPLELYLKPFKVLPVLNNFYKTLKINKYQLQDGHVCN